MLRMRVTLALGLVVSACGLPDNVVVLLPDESETVGRVLVTTEASQKELSTSRAAIDTGRASAARSPFVVTEDVVRSAFRGALTATPRTPAIFTIFFNIGTTEVDPGSAETLRSAIAAARVTTHADISVIGHSDATGSDSDNLTLSLRRAQLVRNALLDEGIPAGLVELGYHGSKNPLIATPPGLAEPRNRRVELTIR